MTTFNIKARTEDLGLTLENITDEIARDLVSAVHNLAANTYSKVVELASQRLHGTRQQYVDALHITQEKEGVWVVYLDPDVNHLEDGYDTFNMLPKLAMGPKSKVSKDGHRYVVIPMRQRMAPLDPTNAKQADLASRLKSLSTMRKWDKVRAGISGKTGKYTTVERMQHSADDHPYIKGLTRIREYATPKSKEPISSAYFTFRTASTKQDASKHWVHPGFKGAKIWPDLERWVDLELNQILVDFVM